MGLNEFSKFYSKHYSKFLFFAQNLTHSVPDAEDLLQEASIKAMRHIGKLESKDRFKAWFQRVIYSCFISKYHKSKRRRELFEKNTQGDAALFRASQKENRGPHALNVRDIRNAFINVKNKYTNAFKLYYRGYSYKEIADIQQIAIGTVKSRINTARKKIQAQLVDAA